MRSHLSRRYCAAFLLCLMQAAGAQAQQVQSGAAISSQMQAVIKARFAGEGAAVAEINPSPIPGLMEVVLADKTIVYSTPDANYFVIGDILDTVNKKVVTQERLAKFSKLDFNTDLPHESALKLGDKAGKKKIFIVADPNCEYCHRYQETVSRIPDLQVEVLLVAVLGPMSQAKAMSIMCAPDPAAAYDGNTRNRTPAPATCEAGEKKLHANYEWLKAHPVKTTPTTYFEDGSSAQGQLSKEDLLKKLAGT
jgi:thiol:disulfide interchange protein DsbC